ncbi:hypothetical protein Zmor_027625 [Zophobas morio]|uniref:Uncharacterized protein n=1 Tax=Zophobas morio TaxID=2755281 RepID=A0AA38M295_9CUCU|nr:hypothetical protein Zmor_027625 [Zophobas morio]
MRHDTQLGNRVYHHRRSKTRAIPRILRGFSLLFRLCPANPPSDVYRSVVLESVIHEHLVRAGSSRSPAMCQRCPTCPPAAHAAAAGPPPALVPAAMS